MPKPKPNNADVLVGLGERIRKLRIKRGWTQVIMAEKIGIDRSFIADLERGKRNITLLNLEVLAKGFGITLSKLLSGL
jgi:transcriptional regulator with XRE-family HTH domain